MTLTQLNELINRGTATTALVAIAVILLLIYLKLSRPSRRR